MNSLTQRESKDYALISLPVYDVAPHYQYPPYRWFYGRVGRILLLASVPINLQKCLLQRKDWRTVPLPKTSALLHAHQQLFLVHNESTVRITRQILDECINSLESCLFHETQASPRTLKFSTIWCSESIAIQTASSASSSTPGDAIHRHHMKTYPEIQGLVSDIHTSTHQDIEKAGLRLMAAHSEQIVELCPVISCIHDRLLMMLRFEDGIRCS